MREYIPLGTAPKVNVRRTFKTRQSVQWTSNGRSDYVCTYFERPVIVQFRCCAQWDHNIQKYRLLRAFFYVVHLGKAANFLLFACIMLLLLYKSEETNERKYYCIMGIGILAMALEIQQQYGLAIFNTLSFVIVSLSATGFLDL